MPGGIIKQMPLDPKEASQKLKKQGVLPKKTHQTFQLPEFAKSHFPEQVKLNYIPEGSTGDKELESLHNDIVREINE